MVGALVIAGGTETVNSVIKIQGYAKEKVKDPGESPSPDAGGDKNHKKGNESKR